jgi:AcrR family transcriptional regulator
MEAAMATMTERGYLATTVEDIARQASVSLTVFYEHFDSKEDIFIALLNAGKTKLFEVALPAFQEPAEWPEKVRSAFETTFAFFAAEPVFARLAKVEAYAAGTNVLDRRDSMIAAEMDGFLGLGYVLAPKTPAIYGEAIGGAIYELLHRLAQGAGTESTSSAAPLATYIALAPFLGPDKACAVANGE